MSEKPRYKQIVFRPRNEHEAESIQLLSENYPHMNNADLIGELVQQWRLRHDKNNTKEAKLDIIVHLLFEVAQHLEQQSGVMFPSMMELRRAIETESR